MLFVCGCRFFGAAVFVSGPVAGLLGRAAAFRVLVFSKAADLFVVCGCHFLLLRSWILLRACHWPAWSAVFREVGLVFDCFKYELLIACCPRLPFFCSGSVAGLLGWAAAFRKVFFSGFYVDCCLCLPVFCRCCWQSCLRRAVASRRAVGGGRWGGTCGSSGGPCRPQPDQAGQRQALKKSNCAKKAASTQPLLQTFHFKTISSPTKQASDRPRKNPTAQKAWQPRTTNKIDTLTPRRSQLMFRALGPSRALAVVGGFGLVFVWGLWAANNRRVAVG